MGKDIKKIFLDSYFLIEFNFLKENSIFNSYLNCLEIFCTNENLKDNLNAYSKFLLEIKKENITNFSFYIKDLIINLYDFKDSNQENIEKELNIISNLVEINLKELLISKFQNEMSFENIAEYKNYILDFSFENLKNKQSKQNHDIFNKNRAFIFNDNLQIKPIEINKVISFKNLKGYKQQKEIIYNNTKALINGLNVNNILLYGDAGCGKSSTVRALLSEFNEIKIVQIFKKNLIHLDKLYSILKNIPSKFIIFADDISFNENDETFSTMKAVLEGSLIQCPNNVAIYATSNRRHLVKEGFKSRIGDEIHLNDTINEINSLSERFGITLLFSKPNNEEFKNIVSELADDNHLEIDKEELYKKAQRLALIKGSNSPRIAQQLINNLIAGIEI